MKCCIGTNRFLDLDGSRLSLCNGKDYTQHSITEQENRVHLVKIVETNVIFTRKAGQQEDMDRSSMLPRRVSTGRARLENGSTDRQMSLALGA